MQPLLYTAAVEEKLALAVTLLVIMLGIPSKKMGTVDWYVSLSRQQGSKHSMVGLLPANGMLEWLVIIINALLVTNELDLLANLFNLLWLEKQIWFSPLCSLCQLFGLCIQHRAWHCLLPWSLLHSQSFEWTHYWICFCCWSFSWELITSTYLKAQTSFPSLLGFWPSLLAGY